MISGPTFNLRSQRACRLSVAALARLESWSTSYLHTLTFANPEPDVFEAQRRFRSWQNGWVNRREPKLRFVWCLQRGGKTKRVHFHFVTGAALDWREMWSVLPKYQFGRYDCSPYEAAKFGPWSVKKALYVAKYVARRSGLERGVRNWGAVGFVKCKQGQVVADSFELPIVAEVPRWLLSQISRTSLLDSNYARRKASLVRAFEGLAAKT